MSLPFNTGSKVRCRNQIWEVGIIADNGDGSWTVRLYPENGGKPQPFLYPHTPIEPFRSALENLEAGRLAHTDHYRLLTSATRLSLVYEYDKLLSISNSKMIPEYYQLLAVKKVMESLRQRFLIADDVGLGKTIEAGLIMQELAARHRGQRVLIVAPASLQDQWKKEMQRHFLRSFYIYNRHKMEGIQELVDENLNPWLAKNSIVTSIDWVKPHYEGSARKNVNPVFDQLMKVEKRWDMVIIDEAHYVSTNANRADFARAIQDKCDSLLLLTATPHSGNSEHFFNLLNLLDPFIFTAPEDLERTDARERVDKVMIRRGKETIFKLNDAGQLVKKFRDRVPYPIGIEFTPAERELYDAVSEYTSEGWAQLIRKRKITEAERNIGKFLLTLVQKRMVSSLAALRETLERRIDSIVETRTVSRLDGRESREIKQLLKDYQNGEYMDDDDREDVERYLETRRIQEMYAERTNEVKSLRELLARTEELIAARSDSKLKWLTTFLQKLFTNDPNEKVIIFTEYKDTLDYLKSELQNKWYIGSDAIVTIHGGMPLGEDENEQGSKLYAECRFNDPDTRILLATDAASEGLNLQRHCHTLINYELPWNPNRLEQRIGRIHRYGQKHRALVYNLMIAGSKEAEIFKLLQQKIEVIRKQLGNMAEVLGVLERVSLDEVILRALNPSVKTEDVVKIAEQELKKMSEIAESLREAQFLSGCRQFTREDIHQAVEAIADSQKAIPQPKDVKDFVETFLRVYGDAGNGQGDGRKLHPTNHKGVFRLIVPSVIQDDMLPRVFERVTFDRAVATLEWARREEPDFLAFGHPLLARMVHYCRVTKAAELQGKVAWLIADYAELPGIIFNFLLRFEDREGHVIREELEPVFVDQEGTVHPDLGRRLFLRPSLHAEPQNQETRAILSARVSELKSIAENHIRTYYQDYYRRVEASRNADLNILLADLDRFDQGIREPLEMRLRQIEDSQLELFDEAESSIKAQRTRLENQLKLHNHRMQERRAEVERMRLDGFPAPELLNLVIVTPV